MKITDCYSQEAIEWLITHAVTMNKIIHRKTNYCSIIHSNILKQHSVVLEHAQSINEAKQQKPLEAA
jgi:hypothetical protein